MGNLSIDMLMRLDREKLIEVPVKDVKADRLSQLMGQDVTVRSRRFREIPIWIFSPQRQIRREK